MRKLLAGFLWATLSIGLIGTAQAATITWTNTAGGSWKTATNWSPAKVPGSSDNVVINRDGNYSITISANASIGSLTLGGGTGTPTLSITAGTFSIATNGVATVLGGAVLELAGGIVSGDGMLNIAGTMNWSKGEIRSLVQVAPAGHLNLSANNLKFLSSGVLNNQGTTVWSGNGAFQLGSGSSLTNSGLFEVQNDLAIFSTNKVTFVNSGTFRKTTASGITAFDAVGLLNSGTIDLQTGGLGFGLGKSSLSDGTRITGAGSVWVYGAEVTLSGTVTTAAPLDLNGGSLKGVFNLVGDLNWHAGSVNNGATISGTLNLLGGVASGSMTVNGPVNFSSGEIKGGLFTINGNLNWTGGTMSSTKLLLNGDANWSGGTLSGSLVIPQGRSLALLGGAAKVIDGGTLSNRSTVVISAPAALSCSNSATIYNYGTFRLNHDTPFSGGGGNPSRFYNYGTVAKSAAGQLNWSFLELHNAGVIEIQAGALALATKAHSLENNCTVNGPGRLLMQSGSLTLGTNVNCAPPLEILDGALIASGCFNGDIEWTKGSLSGVLTLTASHQLHLAGAGTKTFNKDSVLNVAGSTLLDGNGLLFYANATINNSGNFEIQTGGGFAFNGSDLAWFNNMGTLRKTISTATLPFGALQLVNSGTLEVQTGEISFVANTHTLRSGSQFLGPGALRVNGGMLNLDGAISSSMPLYLVLGSIGGNGTFTGALNVSGGQLLGTVTVDGPVTWSGGAVVGTLTAKQTMDWSGGTISGTLLIPASGSLTAKPGGIRTLTGAINNAGLVTVQPLASITVVSGSPVVNSGVFAVQDEIPFKLSGSSKPVFINSGTFRKTGSTRTLSFSFLILQNTGTIDVQAGGIDFTLNTHTLASGSRITGSGPVRVAGATVTMNTLLRAEGPMELASGYLLGDGTIEGSLAMSGGQLPGVVVVTNAFAWSGGEVKGTLTANRRIAWSGGTLSGTLNVPATCQFDIADGNTKLLTGTLNNYGTLSLLALSQVQMDSGCVINNAGLCETWSATPFAHLNGGTPTFNNTGTFRKLGAGDTAISLTVLFNNSGLLDVASNSLSFISGTHTFSSGSRLTGAGVVRVAGATVNWNGAITNTSSVELASGLLNAAGSLNGALRWSGGTLGGLFTVAPGSEVHLVGTTTKTLGSVTVTNRGAVILEGSGPLAFSGDAIIENNGLFELQAANSFTMPNSGKKCFNNYGTLRKTGSSQPFVFSNIILQNNGTLDVQAGTISFTAGSHTFNDGSTIMGSGLVQVVGATVNIAGNIKVNGSFTLNSGLVNGLGCLDGDWTWSGGAIAGTLTHKAGNTLRITGSSICTFNQAATLLNAGTILFDSSKALGFYDRATINNSGLFEWRGSVGFALVGSGKPVFINSGTFRKTTATTTLAFDVIQLQNSGVLDIQAGVLSFPALSHAFSDGSRAIGSAIVRVSGATVTLGGTVTFDAPFEFTAGTLLGTATIQGNVTWSGGTMPGGSSAAAFTVNGNLSWSGGTLYGTLTENGTMDWSDGTVYGTLLIQPSARLNIRNGGNPTLGGVLTNAGLTMTVGNASLTVMDKSFVLNGAVLEAPFEKPFTFSGNGSSTLINFGTLRKTVSTRALDFSSVRLDNRGTLDLQAGDLTFSANSHSFADGTRTMGLGTVRVIGGTLNVSGTNTLDAPFEVASGFLAGTAMLDANGAMTWSGGNIQALLNVRGNASWTGGELSGTVVENGTLNWAGGLVSGTLTVPVSARVNVLPGGNKSISGVLQNAGTAVVSNNANIVLISGTPIVNSGLFEVQNEQALKPNGTTKVTFGNSGTFRKTISTKLMKFDYVLLQNSGTLDVQAGELSLTLNTHSFADGSRTTGNGAVRVAGATLNVAGSISLGPPLALDSGYLAGNATLNGPFQCGGGEISDTLTVNGQLSLAGGLLKGGIYAQGAASWTGGEIDGWLCIATNSTLAIGGAGIKTIKGGTITNSGFVTVTSPVTIQADGGAVIQNMGGFNLPASVTVTTPAGKPTFNNYGALSLTNGFGVFNFPGQLTLFPSGRLEVELAGRNAGANFSQIVGVPEVVLDGAMVVRRVGGFEPILGDRLEIIKCADRVGTFATYSADTPRLSPDYSLTNVTLIAAAPSITNQPQSLTVVVSNTATFSVGVAGTQPLAYQWCFNGSPLSGAVAAVLTLTNVQPSHDGNYSVTVSNVWGATTSSVARLTVNTLPVITQQPVSLVVNEGEDAAFNVVATGTYLRYQWRFGADPISGATNASLFLTNVTAAQGGRYKVDVLSGIAKLTSVEVMLTVISPPQITEQPASKNVNLGSSVTLSVKSSGTTPLSYQWMKDGVAIPGANAISFVISRMTRELEGIYQVIVANPAGYEISSPAVLLVNTPPSITLQPVSQTVNRGTNVVFSVIAEGVPAPTYQWQLNGVNLYGATQPTLLLTNVQPKDSGKYSVVAANSFGAAESIPADLQVTTPPIPFTDNFVDRGILYTTNGFGRGTNCSATKQVGEPTHAGKGNATNSVWISWWAPANGIATFTTAGSDFDTVMAVYRGTNVNALTKIAADDDSAGFHWSKVSFNAQAGTYYQIAVAGFAGACGDITLGWDLLITTELLPQITQAPRDFTGNTNDNIVLQVLFDAFEPTAIQWFYQGQLLANATNSLLTIDNLQSDKVGGYAVRLAAASGRTVVSPPGDIQINTEGVHAAHARNKFGDTFDGALIGADGVGGLMTVSGGSMKVSASGSGVSRGYTGTQVFSTYGADKEEGEPNHCGVPGGASSWFFYQAPRDGTMIFDTEGSSFDTVLAVYTGPGTDFASLVPVACDNNSGSDGFTSKVFFNVTSNTMYYVAVDGVNGASGTVKLNYALGTAPTILAQPISQTACVGSNATLHVQASGVPGPAYQWSCNGLDVPGATGSSLTLSNFQPSNAGFYQVRVSNSLGTILSDTAELLADGPLRLARYRVPTNGCFGLRVVGPANKVYVIECTTDLAHWTPVATNGAPTGLWDFVDGSAPNANYRYYRVKPLP